VLKRQPVAIVDNMFTPDTSIYIGKTPCLIFVHYDIIQTVNIQNAICVSESVGQRAKDYGWRVNWQLNDTFVMFHFSASRGGNCEHCVIRNR
jgi:hypothetical protein